MVKLLRITLRFALLAGLFPMSNHMLSMQTRHMNAATTFQIAMSEGHTAHGSMVDNSTESCCNAVCPISTVCGFLVPDSTDVALSGDSEQFPNSDPVAQLIYLTALAPPPKA
jgi:hypothetical protein